MNILISENIKRLRKNKNITQEQLAEAMGVSVTAVSKWERGETYPDITLLSPLAYYFGVTIDELMGYDESKINKEIDDFFEEYGKLRRTRKWEETLKLISEAYEKYPNDYRIMHLYMWDMAGDYADNVPEVLLSRKAEFLAICDKILDGCADEAIRLDTYNMRAKILHAEGKTEEALTLYREKFASWYSTWEQKSEQLFAKDTPEFLYWVRKNMYELASFAADKLSKSVFFDASIPYDEKVKKIEGYGDLMMSVYNDTGEALFLAFSASIMARLANDLKFRGGKAEDIERTREKSAKIRAVVAEKAKENQELKEAIFGS